VSLNKVSEFEMYYRRKIQHATILDIFNMSDVERTISLGKSFFYNPELGKNKMRIISEKEKLTINRTFESDFAWEDFCEKNIRQAINVGYTSEHSIEKQKNCNTILSFYIDSSKCEYWPKCEYYSKCDLICSNEAISLLWTKRDYSYRPSDEARFENYKNILSNLIVEYKSSKSNNL
jgi:hypothetical protein